METYSRIIRVDLMKKVCTFLLAAFFSVNTCAAQSDSLIRIDHLSYSILYNTKYNCPSLVFWTLEANDLGRYSRGQHIAFMEDRSIPSPRVTSSEYSSTGYHRGHLCPSGDRGSSYEKWADTFFMSNIAPMLPRLNTGAWKATENECRSMASTGCFLLITAIPLWIDSIAPDFGKRKIKVPSHFYKRAMCIRHPDHTIHWLMRNTQDRQYMPSCVITPDSALLVLKKVRSKLSGN